MDTTSQKLPDDLATLKAQVKSLDAELFVALQKYLAINAKRGIQDEKLRASREQEDTALELKRQNEDEEFECTKSYIIHKQIELESRINALNGAGSASTQVRVERFSNELGQENIKIKMQPGLDSQQPPAPALALSDLGAMHTDILTSRVLGKQPVPFPAKSISTAIPGNEQREDAVRLRTSLIRGERRAIKPSSLGIDSLNTTTLMAQSRRLQNTPDFKYKYNKEQLHREGMHPDRAAAMTMAPINRHNVDNELAISQHNNCKRKAGSSPQFPLHKAIQRATKRPDFSATLQEKLIAARRVAFVTNQKK